jgi:hypothetical protein
MFCALLVRPGAVKRGRIVLMATTCALVFFPEAGLLGGYWDNYQRTGTFFVLNVDPEEPPKLFELTYPKRPGIVSVVDGFATFRLPDMLRQPMNTTDPATYPRHRTSFWSQLYGAMHSIHFAGYPPSWRPTPYLDCVLWIDRAALLVG